MKILNKILPYKMRVTVPTLGLMGATMLGACGHDEDDIIQPAPQPPIEQHTTTYVWGPHMSTRHKMTPAELTEKLQASADSAEVSKVIMYCDEEDDWGAGFDVKEIYDIAIEPMTPKRHREKVVHAGGILRPAIYRTTPEEYASQQRDSARLADMGYKIIRPIYRTR